MQSTHGSSGQRATNPTGFEAQSSRCCGKNCSTMSRSAVSVGRKAECGPPPFETILCRCLKVARTSGPTRSRSVRTARTPRQPPNPLEVSGVQGLRGRNMNRREAIAALMAFPQTARITATRVSPSDVIVLECDEPLSDEGRAILSASLKQIWPDNRLVVCDRGMRLKVLQSPNVGG